MPTREQLDAMREMIGSSLRQLPPVEPSDDDDDGQGYLVAVQQSWLDMDTQMQAATERTAAAEAQCAAMREALEDTEYGKSYEGASVVMHMCPVCDQTRGTGHAPDCPVGTALATDAGAALLAVADAATQGYLSNLGDGAFRAAIIPAVLRLMKERNHDATNA